MDLTRRYTFSVSVPKLYSAINNLCYIFIQFKRDTTYLKQQNQSILTIPSIIITIYK